MGATTANTTGAISPVLINILTEGESWTSPLLYFRGLCWLTCKYAMKTGKVQAVRFVTVSSNLELKLVKLSHIMPDMGNEVGEVVPRLLGKHTELTDMSGQSINAVDNDFKLLPMLGVVFRDIRSAVKNFWEKMKMPGTVFVDRTVPMVVVTEWARTPSLSTFPMEPRKAVITLNSI